MMPIQPMADGAQPVFNRANLLQHCMEDQSLAHNLLELYLTDLTLRATALRAAFEQGDLATVQQMAHAIRGASLTVGAESIAALTQDIESACRRHDRSGIAGVLPELERRLAATREAMQRMLGETPPR
jgi:HPt (histidine-containing phosphotransfer) domain-containing protein